MNLTKRDIVIAGGGIGGMAAGLALAQRGARVTIHERRAAFEEVGAGLQIGPSGMRVLDALGLGDAVRAVGTSPEAIVLRDYRDGRALMEMPLGAAAEKRWGAPYLHLHRADLLSLLVEAAERAGVAFEMNSKVTGFEHSGLRLEGGRRVEGDCVIAADGVRSAVRRQMWDGEEVRFTGQVAWRGLVKADRLPEPLPPQTHLILGPGRHLVLYRLRGGDLINFVAVEERENWAEEGWSHPDDPDTLRRAFDGFGGLARPVLDACEETFLWGLFEHPPLPHWREGHMAVLGDAAHPMLPFLAAGAVSALEDAWVLAAMLEREETVTAALAAYEAARKPRATRIQKEAAGQARLYHLQGPLRPFVHLGMRMTSTLMPGFAAARFDWLYGHDVTIG
ncbi:MAG: FAD-dependent monooxygenase [Rubricella sp.]